jgi:hypothetical protein
MAGANMQVLIGLSLATILVLLLLTGAIGLMDFTLLLVPVLFLFMLLLLLQQPGGRSRKKTK